jgi:hypothetical protein
LQNTGNILKNLNAAIVMLVSEEIHDFVTEQKKKLHKLKETDIALNVNDI